MGGSAAAVGRSVGRSGFLFFEVRRRFGEEWRYKTPLGGLPRGQSRIDDQEGERTKVR